MINTNIDLIKKQVRDRVKNDIYTLRNKLENIGADVMTDTAERYKHAVYDGQNDIYVGTKPHFIGDVMQLQAHGESLLFIEFGTGITYPDRHPLEHKFGYLRGSYGQHQGSLDEWGFYGRGRNITLNAGGTQKDKDLYITQGNPANPEMYNAVNRFRDKLKDIKL